MGKGINITCVSQKLIYVELIIFDPDINECVDGIDACDDDAFCTNVAGGYVCTCAPGFIGDGFTCTAQQFAPQPCGRFNSLCNYIQLV